MADESTEHIAETAAWYSRAAQRNRITYLLLKVIQLLLAAAIPVTSLAISGRLEGRQGLVNGVLGAALLVIEGLQQLGQFQQHWTRYRSTSNSISRELLLFRSRAHPYNDGTTATQLLAERSIQITGQENEAWNALQTKLSEKN